MNLVTVCGHNTTMLYHMLNHYHLHMDEIFVVLYAHHKKDPIIEQGLHILEKFNLKPIDYIKISLREVAYRSTFIVSIPENFISLRINLGPYTLC